MNLRIVDPWIKALVSKAFKKRVFHMRLDELPKEGLPYLKTLLRLITLGTIILMFLFSYFTHRMKM